MKRSTNMAWAELKVGILLVGAFLIGTVTIVSFTGIREYFRPTFEINTQMHKVAGLKPGAVIMLSGVRVGNVSTMHLSAGTGQGVDVTLKIFDQYSNNVRRDARATLGSQGLLGDKYIELEPGTGDAGPVQPGDIIASGGDPTDISAMVGQAENLTERMNTLLTEMTLLTHELRSGTGSVNKLIKDSTLYDNASRAAKQATDTAKKFGDTAEQISTTAKNYAQLSERLDATLLKPDGTLKRLANNPEPFEHLNQALARFDTLSKKLTEGDGTLSRLINDGTVDKELGGLLKDLRRLVQKMESNPKKYLHLTVF